VCVYVCLCLLYVRVYNSLPRVGGVDYVIHLAAVMDFYPKDEDRMMRANVEGEFE
jgi:nucleoside-diphosphate-sugar epimerase